MEKVSIRSATLRWAALVGVSLLLNTSCSSLDSADEVDTIGGVPTIEVDELAEQPDHYLNKKVSIMGEAGTILSNRAFVLEELSLFFEDKLLVLARSDIQLGDRPIADDDMLRVEGIVYRYDRAALEKELGWSLPQSFDQKWKNRPVLVTHMVVAVYDYGRWEEGVTNRQKLESPEPEEARALEGS